MRCETTSSVKECALRARSTHAVHHAIVEVNIVIGVVLGEVLVARVVPLVDAVIGLTLGLIAHVVTVVFVVAILHRIFLYGRYTLYTNRTDGSSQGGFLFFLHRQQHGDWKRSSSVFSRLAQLETVKSLSEQSCRKSTAFEFALLFLQELKEPVGVDSKQVDDVLTLSSGFLVF